MLEKLILEVQSHCEQKNSGIKSEMIRIELNSNKSKDESPSNCLVPNQCASESNTPDILLQEKLKFNFSSNESQILKSLPHKLIS